MPTATPTLCQLEYLTPGGWVVGHHGIALLEPLRYVERLAKNGKFGRAIELDPDLKPTGVVHAPKSLPDPSELVPAPNNHIPQLPPLCDFCGDKHAAPHDGSCLI